jgi:anaerobic selenocysteine-containing dehydrogenase
MQTVTFCRICEAHCGMLATVEHGRVTKLRPDPDHPLSSGYACPKGIAMTDVQNDPDRVLHPLRKTADGGFERVSWETALTDIGARLNAVRDDHGAESIGWYMGNPGAFSYSHTLWVKGFLDALGSPHYYSAGSQDVNNRFAASALMYGSPLVVPIPDLARTSFLLMLGANPMVSHGSVLTAPRVRDQLHAITARGGRVVVVDPRRTETARQFEHVAVTPDADAWLLLSLLQVIFEERLADRSFLAGWTRDSDRLEALAAAHTPEATAERTGVPADSVRALARDFAAADGAAAYGRTGSCLGRHGTVVAFLIDALNAVTGNLDRPGGAVFGRPSIALDDIGERVGLDTYGKVKSRIGGFPDVLGNMPASLIPQEIETPGPKQLRALFVSAGNPVLSVPDGEAMERALGKLDLLVSLDFYVNETNRHADYVLPSTTFLERDDTPVAFLGFYTTPFVQHSDAVVEPAGESREEWEIVEDLARTLGIVPSSVKQLRALGRLGIRVSPQRLLDGLLRTGPDGDLFGLRPRGLNLRKLRRKPHGIVLADHVATGVLRHKIRHRDHRLRLAPDAIEGELRAMGEEPGGDPTFPMRLIGLRELRSHNSWMHNSPLLLRGGRTHAARVHPDDAAACGLADGERVRVSSKSGAIELAVKVTDEMTPGTVAVPHGWGHRGGWRLANGTGGVNVNALASGEADDLERLAGMAFLNGIPVRLEPVARADAAEGGAETAAPQLASA